MNEVAPPFEKEEKKFDQLSGEEPDEFTLYRLHPSEREMALYEKLGVKQFRTFYLATLGYLISKVSKEKFIEGTSVKALDKAIDHTLSAEAMHTMGGIVMLLGEFGMMGSGRATEGTICVALNVLVNLYPVFMQRANRFEMLKVKKRKLEIQERIANSREGGSEASA